MSTKRILDVTLRETPTFFFGKKNIVKTIEALENAGIEMIECAYLGSKKAYTYQEGSTHVNTIEQANTLIPKKKPDILYTICMNGSSYDLHNIPYVSKDGIDAIRYVLMEHRFNDEVEDLKIIKDKGYKLIVQHRNILSYSDEEIIHIIETINEIGADAYSIVDTHGSMYQQDVKRFVNLVIPRLREDIWFGFHGHNNHMLATSNAELFLSLTEGRKDVFVDGSIMGVGIGAGNANTELLALYCNKWENTNYNLKYLYNLMDEIVPDLQNRCKWGYSGEFLITGEHNAMVPHGAYLKENLIDSRLNNINKLINQMPLEYRYKDDVTYWDKYNSFMKQESTVKKIIRQIKKLRILRPIKEIYHKLREVKEGR